MNFFFEGNDVDVCDLVDADVFGGKWGLAIDVVDEEEEFGLLYFDDAQDEADELGLGLGVEGEEFFLFWVG